MEWSFSMIILPAAVIFDFLLGDPRLLPHPIRWMGTLITISEPLFRKLFCNQKLGGLFFSVILVSLTWFIGYGTILLARDLHPYLGIATEIILIYYTVSIRSLYDSAMAVSRALNQGTLEQAKIKIKYIVGRDVGHLNQNGISRAAVETVAENLVDGVISPLFFAILGGAPLAMAFKMVNTLDSMIGYKNEKYNEFGKTAARLDDMVNFLPARLSVIIISLCSQIMYQRGRQAWVTAQKDARNHTSPNAGFPEAAFAGALGVKLGGPNHYQDIRVEKPYIGEEFGEVEIQHIKKAGQLMVLSSIFWTGFLMALMWVSHLLNGIP